jgi:hypothetical protein
VYAALRRDWMAFRSGRWGGVGVMCFGRRRMVRYLGGAMVDWAQFGFLFIEFELLYVDLLGYEDGE